MTDVVGFLAASQSGVGPGIGAFLIVAAIALATYFLIRSMNKQFKKINFDEKDTERPPKRTRNGSGPE